MNSKPVSRRNIVRHEHDPLKGYGWEVIVNRRGKYYREFFADPHYGGKRGALVAAQSYRDDLLARLPPPLPVKTRNARNTSGVVGIVIVDKPRKEYSTTYVIAHWPGGRISFSADKLGFDEAWRRALAARTDALALLGIKETLPRIPPKGSVSTAKPRSKRTQTTPVRKMAKAARQTSDAGRKHPSIKGRPRSSKVRKPASR